MQRPSAQPPGYPAMSSQVLTLTGLTGHYQSQSLQLTKDKVLVIGRDPASCNVLYPSDKSEDMIISSIHCKISFNREKNKFVLTDARSTNGTFLQGGRQLQPMEEIPLENGMEFYLANENNKFRVTL